MLLGNGGKGYNGGKGGDAGLIGNGGIGGDVRYRPYTATWP